MATATIDHATLVDLAQSGAVDNVHIRGRRGEWCIFAGHGASECVLEEPRSNEARVFRSLDTLVTYLNDLGIVQFVVDTEHWDIEQRIPRNEAVALDETAPEQEGETYDHWLMAEVQEAIDDTSPTIPHDEVARDVRAAIAAVKAKRASG